ncbi:hypothetical protein O6H91_02G110800 [Diphasiastrum complanatum]|uniref:Uncharacterized protein n=1 Tax=Diphasiastrum complanatum TaxID=34168 RepID=A0ACC2EJG1_DIPCM|nr:hypothetical protein O6H91_Y506200 [Diphasiastrum complanatum]KAJ7566606.1 hypothetical protein O6H91_02G110800 [Diphasiastrum complanatum]
MAIQAGKKLIKIDVTSDTVCPWCFVGKKYLEKAMDASKDQYNFEVRWHPYLLNPNAPKEGMEKREFYKRRLGEASVEPIIVRMTKMFDDLGYKFKFGGLIGNTLDSHRLIEFAGHQGADKQNALVEELFLSYFTQEKYIGDLEVLVEAAEKVGISGGVREFLEDPNAGLNEIQEQLKKYGLGVTGVPHFLIQDQYKLSGAQPPDSLLQVFQLAASHA